MKVTEIFKSIQGEGKNTGMICTWMRTFACNLQCRGFSQEHPEKPETWAPQFSSTIDLKSIKRIEDLPLPTTGCDSAFSWSANFKHLYPDQTPEYWAEQVLELLDGRRFGHVGHVFTGGEPMLQQDEIVDVVDFWDSKFDLPAWIGIETNGTQHLQQSLVNLIDELPKNYEFYFSISPKLLHVAGERPEKAQKPEVIAEYIKIAPSSYLKFVVNDRQETWDEVESLVRRVTEILAYEPEVWVMPVGATLEQQESDYVPKIADMAIERGYNVSLRNHVLIWGNDQVGR